VVTAPIWQMVSIERDGVIFHGRYLLGPCMMTVLHGGHVRTLYHYNAPPDELACRILKDLVATEPRTN